LHFKRAHRKAANPEKSVVVTNMLMETPTIPDSCPASWMSEGAGTTCLAVTSVPLVLLALAGMWMLGVDVVIAPISPTGVLITGVLMSKVTLLRDSAVRLVILKV